MTTYLVDGADLGSIADAIRLKGGTTASLTFPSAFVSAINAIPTGGEIVSHVGDATATTVSSSAYQSMWYITEASFPMATTIGSYAFQECRALSSVIFSSSITNIGDYAFDYCTGFVDSFPYSISNVGVAAFRKCVGLSSVKIFGTSIGESAFYQCTGLTNLSAANNRNLVIGSYAFCQCAKLSSTLGLYAKIIGTSAFYQCTNLRSVTLYLSSSGAKLSANAFGACYGLNYLKISCSSVPGGTTAMFANTPLSVSTLTGAFGSIYVPSSLLTKFKSATGWSVYSARMKSY